jgi:hypothetical protein
MPESASTSCARRNANCVRMTVPPGTGRRGTKRQGSATTTDPAGGRVPAARRAGTGPAAGRALGRRPGSPHRAERAGSAVPGRSLLASGTRRGSGQPDADGREGSFLSSLVLLVRLLVSWGPCREVRRPGAGRHAPCRVHSGTRTPRGTSSPLAVGMVPGLRLLPGAQQQGQDSPGPCPGSASARPGVKVTSTTSARPAPRRARPAAGARPATARRSRPLPVPGRRA